MPLVCSPPSSYMIIAVDTLEIYKCHIIPFAFTYPILSQSLLFFIHYYAFRYEIAAEELKTTLDNMLSPQSVGSTDSSIKLQTRPSPSVAAVNELCAQQITNCYTSLQSWEEAREWLTEFSHKKTKQSGLTGVDPLQYSDKYVVNCAKAI